ncbi:MAG: photosystem II S4 domain protein [Cyanobacteria bacterium MAG CAR3_bin_5]|nr:photosystem II S4 domain protein [Cyanobacteria bacterium MAG CAR3_bin_5]
MAPAAALDHVLAVAEAALRNWRPEPTGFLDPEERFAVEPVLQQRSGLHWRCYGGITPAERQRLLLAREELPLGDLSMDFALVALKGNFLFDPAELEDFEAALRTTGIDPRGWGDVILLGENGAQLIATPACAAALDGCSLQVRTVAVEASAVPWEHLRHQPRQPRTVTTVEASCRLDAVASAGLGLSRARMAAAVSSGRVRLNGRTVLRPHTELQVGDVVVLRGRGELRLQSRTLTRRQRWRLQLLRC